MEMMSKAEHLILSSMVHGTPLEQHHLVPRMKQRRMGMEWGQSTWAKNPAKKSQKGCTDGTDGWIWLLKFWTERHSKCSTMPGTDISYIFFKKCIIIYIYTCSYLFLFQYFNIHTFACAPFDDCPEKKLEYHFRHFHESVVHPVLLLCWLRPSFRFVRPWLTWKFCSNHLWMEGLGERGCKFTGIVPWATDLRNYHISHRIRIWYIYIAAF